MSEQSPECALGEGTGCVLLLCDYLLWYAHVVGARCNGRMHPGGPLGTMDSRPFATRAALMLALVTLWCTAGTVCGRDGQDNKSSTSKRGVPGEILQTPLVWELLVLGLRPRTTTVLDTLVHHNKPLFRYYAAAQRCAARCGGAKRVQ